MKGKIKIVFFCFVFSNCVFGQYTTVIKPIPTENLLIDTLEKKQLIFRNEKVYVFENKLDRDDMLLVAPKNLPDGKYMAFYSNDTNKIAFEAYYTNGKLNGLQRQYYVSGKNAFFINYENGELNGEYMHYDSNGQIINISNYKDDKRDGKDSFYLKNGVKETEANYKNGMLSGVSKIWNERGQLIREELYKKGKLKKVKKY